ncbi:MAG: cytochrome c biogenesis protein DipZ [Candidatus Saccharimonadia bacterium]
MNFVLIAFLAGWLTVLAPCVLPLLPIILGGSLVGRDPKRPYIIVAALAVSLFVFTVLLKVLSVFLNVPPTIWSDLSGGIIIAVGIVTLWPRLYDEVIGARVSRRANSWLGRAVKTKNGLLAPILTGFALGPVFSSCSPTYALLVATILPSNVWRGLGYLTAYELGLCLFLLSIAIAGRRLIGRIDWAINPDGWFRRVLGVLFIIVGVMVLFGLDTKLEVWLSNHQIFNEAVIEQELLSRGTNTRTTETNAQGISANFNVATPTPAPEITGITSWINTKGESLAALRGKVVLIDFWTYSCINCIHTIPHVEGWYQKYAGDGLVVLGIHAPEFSFEHVLSNVQAAVKSAGITYPVGLDNNYGTWNAYNNAYWPAEYFIDRAGNLRATNFGEGGYENDERIIQVLLSENGMKLTSGVTNAPDPNYSPSQSPETYLGYNKAQNNDNGLSSDTLYSYTFSGSLEPNHWALSGQWNVGAETTVAGSNAVLRYNFSATQAYLVMGASPPGTVKVLVNGIPVAQENLAGSDVGAGSIVQVGMPRLYRLVKSPTFLQNATLELQFSPGVSINAFTFDS